jgi:ATP-dependent Clp protease ATP-binding subunit ClpA
MSMLTKGHMQNNPEIEQIVDSAVKLARDLHHEYVMTEHVLLALIRHEPFRRVLQKFGTDVDLLDQDLVPISHISLLWSPPKMCQPKKTNAWNAVSIAHSHRSCSLVAGPSALWICTWP